MKDGKLKLEAKFALSLHPSEVEFFDRDVYLLNKCWNWTGWTTRQWPAKVILPGIKVYKFDLRPDKRRLCALLTITHGGEFRFSTMEQFVSEVEGLTKRRPNPNDDADSEKKWAEVEKRLSGKRSPCTGICLRWEVIEPVSVNLPGAFPRLGWCDLTKPDYGLKQLPLTQTVE